MPEETQDKAWLMSQDETNYTALSTVRGKACAVCRWFNPYGEYYDENRASCHLVSNWPEPILATGYCDRHEVKTPPEPLTQDPIPVVIVEADELEQYEGYITPAQPSLLTKAFQRLLNKHQPEQVIQRGVDGRRYMVIYTSNGYEDREQEHVATRALKAYVESAWLPDNTWVGDDKHLYWHDKSLYIGDIVWADMLDGFLVEISRENDTPIAKCIWDYMESGVEPHGASHGFRYRRGEKEHNVYNHIRKFETSSLPVSAAANIGTLSEVIPMPNTKAQRLDQIFGIEGASKILAEEGPKALNAKLQELGIKPKSFNPAVTNLNDTTPAEEAVDKAEANFGDLLVRSLDALADALGQIDALRGQVKALTESKELDTLKAALQPLADVPDRLAAIEKELALAPRKASTDPSTQLPDDESQKHADALAEYDDFWPEGAKIPKKG